MVDERVPGVEDDEEWDGYHPEGQQEVPKICEGGCDGQQLTREVDLADKRHLLGDAVCGIQDTRQEVGPWEKRRKHVYAVVRDLDRDDVLEDEQQDDGAHDGICQRPCDAEDGVFVADIEFAANERAEQLTVTPRFPNFSKEGIGWLCHSRSLVVQPCRLEEFEELFAFDKNLALSGDAISEELTLADVRADA